MAQLPFNVSTLMYTGDEARSYANIALRKVSAYFNLQKDINQWKTWLASHGPIMAGLSVDQTWDNATATHGNLDAFKPNTVRGGHAVTIVGYTSTGRIIIPQQLGRGLGRSWLRLCIARVHRWSVLQRIVRSDGLIEVPLTKADNGRVVRLHAGDAISLVLPSNAAAGYRWTCDVHENDVVAVEPADYRTSSAAVGSAGEETWMIRARAKGRAVVHWRIGVPGRISSSNDRVTADVAS
jgi:predicted secreted protein